jgi:hypothetical protein
VRERERKSREKSGGMQEEFLKAVPT